MIPKRKIVIPLPERFRQAQQLIHQALGEPEPMNWRRHAESFLGLEPKECADALTYDAWVGHPALGLAFLEVGRGRLKVSTTEARTCAGHARRVAAVLLAPGPAEGEPVFRQLGFDVIAGAATLEAEARLVEKNLAAAQSSLREAARLLRRGTGDPYPEAAYLQVKSLALWAEGHPRRAIQALEKAAEISASVEDPTSEALAYFRQSMLYAVMDEEEQAQRALRKVADLLPRMDEEDAGRFEEMVRGMGE